MLFDHQDRRSHLLCKQMQINALVNDGKRRIHVPHAVERSFLIRPRINEKSGVTKEDPKRLAQIICHRPIREPKHGKIGF
jgi:hypothetical protein